MAKKASSKAATAELVETPKETDLSFTLSAGAAVVAFLKKATEFFGRADKLEKTALDVLAHAKTLAAPKSGDDDVEVQKFITRCNTGTKTVEAHWDGSDTEPGITRILYRLHRRSTQRRDVAIKALKDAADIGNRLHNGWTAKERARVEEENRKRQEEADRKAREDRERELAALERERVKAEEASPDLSEREEKFVIAVAVRYEPVVAAREAGYANPEATATRLLASKKITKAIELRKKANAAAEQAQAIAAAPIVPAEIVEEKADIQSAAGAHDVTRWKAKVEDEQAFIDAVFAGKLGIPRDVLCIDVTKLNQYARDLKQTINRWPGVKAVSDTKVQ
jgi:hypothetical protein